MPLIEKGKGSDLEENGEFRCILAELEVHSDISLEKSSKQCVSLNS